MAQGLSALHAVLAGLSGGIAGNQDQRQAELERKRIEDEVRRRNALDALSRGQQQFENTLAVARASGTPTANRPKPVVEQYAPKTQIDPTGGLTMPGEAPARGPQVASTFTPTPPGAVVDVGGTSYDIPAASTVTQSMAELKAELAKEQAKTVAEIKAQFEQQKLALVEQHAQANAQAYRSMAHQAGVPLSDEDALALGRKGPPDAKYLMDSVAQRNADEVARGRLSLAKSRPPRAAAPKQMSGTDLARSAEGLDYLRANAGNSAITQALSAAIGSDPSAAARPGLIGYGLKQAEVKDRAEGRADKRLANGGNILLSLGVQPSVPKTLQEEFPGKEAFIDARKAQGDSDDAIRAALRKLAGGK